MKLPNRFGTITKLSGNRRKPFIIKEGKTGKQKTIGYAESYEAALKQLCQYNDAPWNVDKQNVTLNDLYEQWQQKSSVSESQLKLAKVAWNYIKHLGDVEYRQIRAVDVQKIIDNMEKSFSTKQTVKMLFVYLDRLAIENDVISKGYGSLVIVRDDGCHRSKEIFSDDEIRTLSQTKPSMVVDLALIMIHSGWRISEVLNFKKSSVNLKENYIIGGCKTAAGKGRIVPIHKNIFPIVKKYFEKCHSDDEKLFPITYQGIIKKFEQELHHNPHECRHTFRTLMDRTSVRESTIDKLMGHSGSVGVKVYVHKNLEELQQAINLLVTY